MSAKSCSYCGLPIGRAWWREKSITAAADEPLYCCFGCRFAAEVTQERGEHGAAVWSLTKLGLSVFLTLNVLAFTMALWSDTVYGEVEGPLSKSFADLLRYLGLLFSLPVLLLLGGPLLTNALGTLKQGRLSTDLLLMVGVVASFAYSAVSVVRGEGDVYFEVGCVILVIVTLGRWLEATSRLKATAALDQLERLLPDRARLLTEDGRDVSIPLAELAPPASVRVLPGERFPADGRLVSASVSVDQQVLTGESSPAAKQQGDEILAGTLNLDGDVVVEVTAAPSQTAIARLIAAVREARKSQGPYQRLSDRVSSWFFPVIGAVAGITFGLHWRLHSFNDGVMSALAVVLIACPCALGLATPLAVWTALGAAARRHVLFRHGEALERLAEVRELCLDKTGTLTTGIATVTQVLLDDDRQQNEVAAVAKELATSSSHAFSQAIVTWSLRQQSALVPGEITNVKLLSGLGVVGQRNVPTRQAPTSLMADPQRSLTAGTQLTAVPASKTQYAVAIGNVRLMEQLEFEIGAPLRQQIDAALEQGDSLTALGWGGRVRAVFVCSETLRPSVRELLQWAATENMPVTVLTGDHRQRGQRLSDELHVAVQAELLPHEKADIIRQRETRSHVAMVGDGVNDAAALTASHIGISLGTGTDVSRDAAGVCLLNNDLAQLPWAIRLARRTISTIRRNLAWAFGYNGLGVAMAACGWLNPAVAAFLMVVSSLMVVHLSLRLEEG